MSAKLSRGTVLGGKWVIGGVLGEGSCAVVYDVSSSTDAPGTSWVAKVIPLASGSGKKFKDTKAICDTLNHEYQLLMNQLGDFPYRYRTPGKFYGDDENLKVRYMVMEKLQFDLKHFASSSPTPTGVASVGLQVLDGLRVLHSKGWLFVDIKPDNFMMKDDKVIFIDYGLMDRWLSFDNAGPRAQVGNRKVVAGTVLYTSLDCDSGRLPTRKDDLESMAMMLIDIAGGCRSLPWRDAANETELRAMKTAADVVDLAKKRNCVELGEIVLLCRSFSDGTPDYDALQRKLEALRDRPASAPLRKRGGSPIKASGRGSSTTSSSSSSGSASKRGGTTTTAVSKPSSSSSSSRGRGTKRGAGVGADADRSKEGIALGEDADMDVVESLSISKTSPLKQRRQQRATTTSTSTSSSFASSSSAFDAASASGSFDAASGSGEATVLFRVLAGPHEGEHLPVTQTLLQLPPPQSCVDAVSAAGGRRSRTTDKKVAAPPVDEETLTTLGKASEADIALANDEYISDRHMSIRASRSLDSVSSSGGGGNDADIVLHVRDLNSTNGTKLNGKKLGTGWVEIKPGDKLKIGRSVLELSESAIPSTSVEGEHGLAPLKQATTKATGRKKKA